MQNSIEQQKTIARIQQMENIFDRIQNMVQNDRGSLYESNSLKEMLQTLIAYYESGQWLKDYESDGRGELPAYLKRGVLSQDGLYNLLCEIGNLQ